MSAWIKSRHLRRQQPCPTCANGHVCFTPKSGHCYCAVQPPSIGIAEPVMLWAVGCVSHNANDPISSGRDVRRLGCFSASKLEIAVSRSPPISAARAEICGSIITVSVQPGQMQFTVMLRCRENPLPHIRAQRLATTRPDRTLLKRRAPCLQRLPGHALKRY
jgi:hypothetical protein